MSRMLRIVLLPGLLATSWHRARQPARTISYDYSDSRVSGLTIDRATRELLRGEAKRADGSTITMKRVRL